LVLDVFRHQCEVRYWMRLRVERGKDWLRNAMADIEKRRGDKAANALRRDIAAQWAAGNRGEPNDWRRDPKEPDAGQTP
jgi:hypothetical protein